MTINNAQTEQAFISNQQAKKQGAKGFTVRVKSDRSQVVENPPVDETGNVDSTPIPLIPAARRDAEALANQSHQTIAALQKSGLEDAAKFVREQTLQRERVIDRVSDAIAALTDPMLLEGDIMSATRAKVAARTGGWSYNSQPVNYDELFAIPVLDQHLLEGK